MRDPQTCFQCGDTAALSLWWGTPLDEWACAGEVEREYSPRDFDVPASESACRDGGDDDFDGAFDCVDPDCSAAPECVSEVIELPGELPVRFSGSTLGAPDGYDHGAPGSDARLSFVAPIAGTYAFDTLSSGFDTELILLDPCTGREIVRNNAAEYWVINSMCVGYSPESRLEFPLAEGQRVEVVIEGNRGDSGSFELHIDRVEESAGKCDP